MWWTLPYIGPIWCARTLLSIYTWFYSWLLVNQFCLVPYFVDKNKCVKIKISKPTEILVCKSVLFRNVGPCFVFLLLFRWYFNDLLTSKSFSQMSLDGHRFADEWHQMVVWSQVLCFLTIWSLQELHLQKKHVRHTGCMVHGVCKRVFRKKCPI